MQICICPSGLRCRGKPGGTSVVPTRRVSRRKPPGNDSTRSTGAQSVPPQHSRGYHSWHVASEAITVPASSISLIKLRYMHLLCDSLPHQFRNPPSTRSALPLNWIPSRYLTFSHTRVTTLIFPSPRNGAGRAVYTNFSPSFHDEPKVPRQR